jgi:DNA helicase II / ATP-dependent DNA helicase PcrA
MPHVMTGHKSQEQKRCHALESWTKRCMHAKFGNGVVVSYEGAANDMRVQVNFSHHGLKWLALEFAKLTAI